MEKLTLDVERLEVETFELTVGRDGRGTVIAASCSTDQSLSGCGQSAWCDPGSYGCGGGDSPHCPADTFFCGPTTHLPNTISGNE